MRKFSIHFFIFCSPLFIGFLFLDGYISTILKQSNSFAVKEYPTWNSIYSGKIDSDVLIYGNSRAWQHISPKILGNKISLKFYNLGIDGSNFGLQLLRHNELLKYNKKPKVIIQTIDVFTFEKHTNLYNSDQFLPYMLWNTGLEKKILDYKGFHFLDFKIPMLRFYGNTSAINTVYDLFDGKEENPIQRIRGYQGLTYPTNIDLKQLEKIRYSVNLDTSLVELFNQFLKKCKNDTINVILVYTPEFIEGQKCIQNRGEIINLYSKICKKHNIPFYDYSNDSISHNPKLFYNSMHLNKKGAEIFSNKLAIKIKNDLIVNEIE